MGDERRQSPRIACRIRCTLHRNSDHASACVLDVSNGGLCILSPYPIEQDDSLMVHLEVPNLGGVNVRALAWNVRRLRGAQSGKRAWSVGAVLVKADPGYYSLLEDAELFAGSSGNDEASVGGVRANELIVFKVRVKKKKGPRSRLLSLTARDAEEARSLATTDLDDSWTVVDVSEV